MSIEPIPPSQNSDRCRFDPKIDFFGPKTTFFDCASAAGAKHPELRARSGAEGPERSPEGADSIMTSPEGACGCFSRRRGQKSLFFALGSHFGAKMKSVFIFQTESRACCRRLTVPGLSSCSEGFICRSPSQ